MEEGHEFAFFTDVDEFLVLERHHDVTSFAVDHLGLGGGTEDVVAKSEAKAKAEEEKEDSDDEDGKGEIMTNDRAVAGAVGINFRVIGNDCRVTYEPIPVSKRFQYRVPLGYEMNKFVKSLVKLRHMDLSADFGDPHFYRLKKPAVKVDTDGHERYGSIQEKRLYNVASVHHFLFKSLTEYVKKRERGGGTTGTTNPSLISAARRGRDNFGMPLPGGSIEEDSVWRRLRESVLKYRTYDDFVENGKR